MPYMLETTAIYKGLFLIVTVIPMMVKKPEKTPDAPTPATALPIMKVVELGATAQMTDPTSKMSRADT